MEMEHINENTMRVLINQNDLEERGITVLDLLGNQHKIEAFFHKILEEVDQEDKFKDTDMVTFQVVPTQSGLELYISKDGQSLAEQMQAPFLNDKDTDNDLKEFDLTELSGESNEIETIVVFDEFEDLLALVRYFDQENGLSYLHHCEDRYYLTLVHFADEVDEETIERDQALLVEFASRSGLSFDQLEEYGDLIIDGQALTTLHHYFE